MDEAEPLPPAIPAATLILMRDRADGAPEILMTERHAEMAFAAGALVFPGGRIDPEDEAAAAGFPTFADAAARIAAIRETIEETGILPAVSPAASDEDAAIVRAALAGGAALPDALAGRGLSLDLARLTPFARWLPNFRETRRFDTLFFIAEADADAAEAELAEAEAVRSLWAGAADILAEIHAGRAHAIFPTRRNLERLARFASIAEARADAARHPVETITPWVEVRDGAPHVCIPEGIGYPVTSEPLETARRR
ncbi:NUDIX domain-containing protein [Sphingosinicella sp.]|uniref:NUDIX domain-containing protein n=1 Tax=Sphingosinicella sp. TaxID=1917971 RepID=UPI00403824B0